MHFLVEIAGGRPQNVRTIGEFSRLSPNIRIYSKTVIIPWLLQHFRHWSPNMIKVKQIGKQRCVRFYWSTQFGGANEPPQSFWSRGRSSTIELVYIVAWNWNANPFSWCIHCRCLGVWEPFSSNTSRHGQLVYIDWLVFFVSWNYYKHALPNPKDAGLSSARSCFNVLKPIKRSLWVIDHFFSIKGQLGVPLTVYPWYLLCSPGILGDYLLCYNP